MTDYAGGEHGVRVIGAADSSTWQCTCGASGDGRDETYRAHRDPYGWALKATLDDAQVEALLRVSCAWEAETSPFGASVKTLATVALLDHGAWADLIRSHLMVSWSPDGARRAWLWEWPPPPLATMAWLDSRWADLIRTPLLVSGSPDGAARESFSTWPSPPVGRLSRNQVPDALFLQFVASLVDVPGWTHDDTSVPLRAVIEHVPLRHRELLAALLRQSMPGDPQDHLRTSRLDARHVDTIRQAQASVRGDRWVSLATLNLVPASHLRPVVDEISRALTEAT